jgi:subtilisin family serine protease
VKPLALVAAAAALTFAAAEPASAAPSPDRVFADSVAAADAQGLTRIIVKRRATVSAAEARTIRTEADVRHVSDLLLPHTEVVEAEPGQLAEAVADLNADPDVVFAEPDYPVTGATTDPLWNAQWGLRNTGASVFGNPGVADADINATAAWTKSTGAGQTVAVIDSGVELDHPDLAGQLATNPGETGDGKETNGLDDDGNGFVDDWQGWDYVQGDNVPQDERYHGTHVTGIIAAATNNGIGVAGVAPDAKVYPIRVLDANNNGQTSDVANGMVYAGELGMRIANLSLGSNGYSTAVLTAANAYPNTLYVVAAGNATRDVDATPYYPCSLPSANIICVGATTNADTVASFSNWGSASVDLFAPGDNIMSTYLSTLGTYSYLSGTSMATPMVSGIAALLRAADPTLTVAGLRAALLNGTDTVADLAGYAVTAGRADAKKSLDIVAPTSDPDPGDGGGDPGDTTDPGDGGGDPGNGGGTPPPSGGGGGGGGGGATKPAVDTAAPTPAPVPQPDPVAPPVTAGPVTTGAEAPKDAAPQVTTFKAGNSTVKTCARDAVGCTSKPARFTFALDRDAHLKVNVTQRVCSTKSGKRSCRYEVVASTTVDGQAGSNVVKVGQRVGRKTLKRGNYRVVIQAVDDKGKKSRAFGATLHVR